MKAYLDGSGKGGRNDATEFLTLTGVAASDAAWAGFEDRWREVLKDREPKAPYIHMRELIPLKDPFSISNGWDKGKASRLVTDSLMYAQNLDKEEFRTFTCSIDMCAYREVINKGGILPSAYKICSHYCPEFIVGWYLENFQKFYPEKLLFCFDQGEKHKGAFETIWNAGKKRTQSLLNHWHLVENVTVADAKNTPALQLADLLAWGQNRRLMMERTGDKPEWQHLANIAESILPFKRKRVGLEELEHYADLTKRYPAESRKFWEAPHAA